MKARRPGGSHAVSPAELQVWGDSHGAKRRFFNNTEGIGSATHCATHTTLHTALPTRSKAYSTRELTRTVQYTPCDSVRQVCAGAHGAGRRGPAGHCAAALVSRFVSQCSGEECTRGRLGRASLLVSLPVSLPADGLSVCPSVCLSVCLSACLVSPRFEASPWLASKRPPASPPPAAWRVARRPPLAAWRSCYPGWPRAGETSAPCLIRVRVRGLGYGQG